MTKAELNQEYFKLQSELKKAKPFTIEVIRAEGKLADFKTRFPDFISPENRTE